VGDGNLSDNSVGISHHALENVGGHAYGKMGTPAPWAHLPMNLFFATDHARALLSLIHGNGPTGQIGFSLLRHLDVPRGSMVIIKHALSDPGPKGRDTTHQFGY